MKLASKQSVYLGRAATSEEGEAGDGEGDKEAPEEPEPTVGMFP